MKTFILLSSCFICCIFGQSIKDTSVSLEETDPPETLDWRKKGAVTSVKDAGSCSSSWAFAVVASVEAAHFIKTGNLVTLSTQQMVDCSEFYGNNGCVSGYLKESMPYAAFEGLQSEESYPYTGHNQTCQYNKSQVVAKIDSWEYFYDNQYQLVQTLVKFGPVAASLDARELTNYTGGIYSSYTCDSLSPTQGVLIVGYGSENGTDYWILKTSLGTSWGEGGYLRIEKKPNDLACGLFRQTVYPIIF